MDHGVCHSHSVLFLQQESQLRQHTHNGRAVFFKKLFINTDSAYLISSPPNVKDSFIPAFNHLQMGKHFNFMGFIRAGGRPGWAHWPWIVDSWPTVQSMRDINTVSVSPGHLSSWYRVGRGGLEINRLCLESRLSLFWHGTLQNLCSYQPEVSYWEMERKVI